MPALGWRLGLVTAAVTGLLAAVTVQRYNPRNFYRRLLASWIGLGVLLNAVGFFVDGEIEFRGSTVDFTFGNDLAWWWWVIWAVVTLALIAAELYTKSDERSTPRAIDLRAGRPIDLRERRSPQETLRDSDRLR